MKNSNVLESIENMGKRRKCWLPVFKRLLSLGRLSVPNNKILDWSKLKAFAEDKISVNEKLKFGFGRVKNIVGKGENADYQHFLLFP